MIRFTIPGDPVAKGRPRATTIGGKARMFTPAKTERFESKVAVFAQQAMAGRAPLDQALVVRIEVWMPIPASWSGTKQRAAIAGQIRPTGRPDADNLAKAVTDGANGIVWCDDSRIVDLHVTKRYSPTPRVELMVAAMLNDPPIPEAP